jgi:N-acetylmuramoyl-L-alanine amidase
VIDPAHGGADSGAALNAAIPEKDVTLVLARRLRQELLSRGIQSQLLRDTDLTVATDQRASQVNGLQPRLYLAIHASSQGSGLRLYSAILPDGGENAGPFLDWQTAQAAALPRSRSIQDLVAAAIQKTDFPVRKLSAGLRPLNSVTMPAIAVEVAPTTGDVSQLASAEYQQMVCAEMAKAIASTLPLLMKPGAQP